MKLIKQPNLWSCAPTAWAMALGLTLEQVIKELGHDGSVIAWPDEPEPKCRLGFHPQEFVRLALRYGYAATPIELFPVLKNITLHLGDNWSYFETILLISRGVIEGQGHRCKHAVAYEYGTVYDPSGEIYQYSKENCEDRDFFTQCAWRLYAV